MVKPLSLALPPGELGRGSHGGRCRGHGALGRRGLHTALGRSGVHGVVHRGGGATVNGEARGAATHARGGAAGGRGGAAAGWGVTATADDVWIGDEGGGGWREDAVVASRARRKDLLNRLLNGLGLNRLNTIGLLRRKHMHLDDYKSELCIWQKEETLHLFVKCNFAQQCWASIGLNVTTHLRIKHIIKWLKRKLVVPFYMDIIIMMSWSIWVSRNEWIFRNIDPTVQNCRRNFFKEMDLGKYYGHFSADADQ
ncbi:hypothetical protein EJB05_57834, partial [Eragrostis curvula]